jgi:hypothetical protein
MDVYGTSRGHGEDRARQDAAVGGDDEEVRFEGSEALTDRLVFQGLGLEDLEAVAEGCDLDFGLADGSTAPCRAVGLGDDRDEVIAGFDQRFE